MMERMRWGRKKANQRSPPFGFPRAYILGARPINPTNKEETYTLYMTWRQKTYL